MSVIVKVARDPVLVRLLVGVFVGLVSFEATRLLIAVAGGHIP
ncbi:MAG: hypothetical protein ABI740_03750 [Alphaproteobacteria bacterium]